MEKQERINDHFDVTAFIEELIEEEIAGIKKEANVIEEGNYDIEDTIPEDIQKKLRD
jgi:hypothetical protein